MSYFADQDIDTRTCGQADEDAWLDRRDDGLTVSRYTRNGILAGLEAQRFNASYAARPLATKEQKAQDIAQRMIDANNAGDLTTAKALALELKPLLEFLP